MRKLLLATVAALGASMGAASYADAQIVVDNSEDGQSFPTPGTVTVRLNGRFRAYGAVIDNGAARAINFGNAASLASTSASTVATNTTNAGINKLSNYGFLDYARLYPGFDGVAANGLKYGASLEIREDNNYAAGNGVLGSVTGSDRSRNLLYLRRQWGYLGTAELGTLRIGAADNPGSLYLTGTFENFDAGGLNGDTPSFLPGNMQLNYPYDSVGNIYATNKIVYLSPQFYGFDGGLSWEPTTAAGGSDNASGTGATAAPGQFIASGNGVATPGSDNLSSTSTGDVGRRKNLIEALIRYRGTFGPVGIAATAQYDESGRVQDSGIAGNALNPTHYKLEDISRGDFGLAITFAGFSVGGNYAIGRYNVQSGGGWGSLIAKGQPDAQSLIVGGTYTIGPVIVGMQYLRSNSMGDQATATNFKTVNAASGLGLPVPAGGVAGGQRLEQGFAAGATYSLSPGVSVFLSGEWVERRQNGYNFITGASNNASNNKVQGSVVALGTSFAW